MTFMAFLFVTLFVLIIVAPVAAAWAANRAGIFVVTGGAKSRVMPFPAKAQSLRTQQHTDAA